HRLLQGEVGSGKTVVALTALLMAVQGGHQGALMAPTEVLAEQHHVTVRALIGGLTVSEAGSLLGERPVRVELLTNRTSAAELRERPKGRAPITTEVVGPSPLERTMVYERVRAEVAAGRQAFVVCPLVEGSTKLEAKAATEEFERLAREELAGLGIGLLHGQ